MNIWDYKVLGSTLSTWVVGMGASITVFAILDLLKRMVAHQVRVWAKRTETPLDDLTLDLANRTWYLFLITLSIYVGSRALPSVVIQEVIRAIVMVLFLIQGALWITGLINHLAAHQIAIRRDQDAATATTIGALGFGGKILVWVIALLLALDNLPKVELDSLIASLGIGGIAVALAVQNILGDLFASLSIILDKPFVIGDFVNVGEYSGTVERIGLKSTRVRSLTGEQLVFSNSDLLNSRIRNYKRMVERRVSFTIGVSPQTPYETLIAIPQLLQEVITTQPQVRFERAHFVSYGEFTLDFQVVYYMLTSDYTTFMDTQQTINFEIYRRFGEAGIDMPYPTQTIRLAQ